MPASRPNPIILYDGICVLCNRWVQFVMRHDSRDRFRFASLQSEFTSRILRRHGIASDELDTMFVVLDHAQPAERLASRADAAIVILQQLGGGWSVLGLVLKMVPRWLRNWGYNLVARNRYRVFGKYDACPMPSEKDRGKFLDLK